MLIVFYGRLDDVFIRLLLRGLCSFSGWMFFSKLLWGFVFLMGHWSYLHLTFMVSSAAAASGVYG
jgi:hypothetical protein